MLFVNGIIVVIITDV